MVYNKEIVVKENKINTSVKASIIEALDQKIVFSFSFFKGFSIKLKDFNNHYANENDAKKSVSDFFKTLTSISNMSSKEFYSTSVKEQLHFNPFTNNKHIDRIENILIEGYGMAEEKVKNFERSYFEFSFSNGKRAIGTIIYDNLFEILFIDNNHLICLESSRNVKSKMSFEVPGIFGWKSNSVYKELNYRDVIDMLVDDIRNDKYTSFVEFIKDYEEIKEYI